jgi:hypothetical protein
MSICLQPAGELFARQIGRDVAAMHAKDASIRRRFERWREMGYPGTWDEPPAEPLTCPLCRREFAFGIDCPDDGVGLVGTSVVVAAADGIARHEVSATHVWVRAALIWWSAVLVALASSWFLAAVLLPWVLDNPAYTAIPWSSPPERAVTYEPRASNLWHYAPPPVRDAWAGRLWVEARSEGIHVPGLLVGGPGLESMQVHRSAHQAIHVPLPDPGAFEVSLAGDETATQAYPVLVRVYVDNKIVVDTKIVLEPTAPPLHVCDVDFPSGEVRVAP